MKYRKYVIEIDEDNEEIRLTENNSSAVYDTCDFLNGEEEVDDREVLRYMADEIRLSHC